MPHLEPGEIPAAAVLVMLDRRLGRALADRLENAEVLGAELLEVFVELLVPGVQYADLEGQGRRGDHEVGARNDASDDGHCNCGVGDVGD
ncbi:hypothetical protein VTJ04DRAFT_5341 [Mycothermus thermophilus]|uniref:uncharacterized protein n=1 Tax=Humicola insolens TaxID=85995 RepID=UPI0037428BEA